MLNNETIDCFGYWCFEDMVCMTCNEESKCQTTKRNKEIEYKKSIKDERCHKCMDLVKCHQQIKNCFGNLKQDCITYKCKCRYECDKNSYKELKVKCVKSITMRVETIDRFEFEKDKEYTLYCTDSGLLSTEKSSYGVVLGRKDHYRLGDIFDRYFIIIPIYKDLKLVE